MIIGDIKEKYNITILTPTYNREKYLPKLFHSLCGQTNLHFQWLIIDDGSTDQTLQYIQTLKETPFLIEYHRKENGGKHTALNYAHPYIKGELVLVVDSDDYLLHNAVEVIENDWKKYCERKDVGVFSYLKCFKDGKFLSVKSEHDYYVDDDISYRINNNITGDRCEVIRADLIKKYPFPVFSGEKFMSEGWLFRKIAYSYKTVYRNEKLYVCEYLEGGLSKRGRLLRMQCPLGMMENCKTFLVPQVRKKVQVKEMWLLWVYGLCAGYSIKKIVKYSEKGIWMYLSFPFGFLIYKLWKFQYK